MSAAEEAETRTRRSYVSPVRSERAAKTRERIIAAGAEILHEHAVWNWNELTMRGVARRAGVNERTVYRHFTGEAELRRAVMTRLEQEAGVVLDEVLDRFPDWEIDGERAALDSAVVRGWRTLPTTVR